MGRAILLGCIIAVVSCASDDEPASGVDELEMELREDVDGDDVTVESTPSDTEIEAADTVEFAEAAEAPRTEGAESVLAATMDAAVPSAPNRCERLRMHIREDGRRRYRRIRRPWTRADQRRFGQLVGLVAREMGADPRLIRTWAIRESSYRPHAMHVLNPDVEAAMAAWRRLHYSAEEEAELLAAMEQADATDSRYWRAKARLHQVQTFRDNPHLDDVVYFEVQLPDGTRSQGSEPAWAFGYGPFGFNPAYYVPVWDSRAPPWVFCDEGGLIAIITAVWVARAAQHECESQGFGGSYASVNRRFSRGHCGPVSERASFRWRARQLGLDPDAHAKLGRKWKRSRTDRGEILQHMRDKATAAGLLSGVRPPGA